MSARLISVGTLGGPATFAGEATQALCARHPEFGAPVYFPSIDDCWRELGRGSVEVIVVGAQRSGQAHRGEALMGGRYYVIDEHAHALQCNLYAKPGTRKAAVRRISGHSSMVQCAAWLDREFPGVPREMHRLNSVAAAAEVLAGDGTAAVVGSRSLPQVVGGLEALALGIDDGALGSWWAVSREPRFSEQPQVALVAARCASDGALGALVAAMADADCGLDTAAAFPVPEGFAVYDYLLTFGTRGSLADIRRALARFAHARLVGAWHR